MSPLPLNLGMSPSPLTRHPHGDADTSTKLAFSGECSHPSRAGILVGKLLYPMGKHSHGDAYYIHQTSIPTRKPPSPPSWHPDRDATMPTKMAS